MPACFPLSSWHGPSSLVGSCRGYQTALRLQGRSLVPPSLPVPARRPVWCRLVRATREGGRPSVERECQAGRSCGGNRAGSREHTHSISAMRSSYSNLPRQHEVQYLPSSLIFLGRSPLGVRTRDLPHGLVDSSRRSMVVCFAHLPPILPPTRANRDEYWRTAQRQERRKIRHWHMMANKGGCHSRSSTLPYRTCDWCSS